MSTIEELNTVKTVKDLYLNSVNNVKENWVDYLKYASKVHKYEFGNSAILYEQNSDYTKLATSEQWLKLGRTVNDGSLAMATLQRDADNKLKLEYVFDISQTTGREVHPFNWNIDEAIINELLEKNEEPTFNQLVLDLVALKSPVFFEKMETELDGSVDIDKVYEIVFYSSVHTVLSKFNNENEFADKINTEYLKSVSDVSVISKIGGYISNISRECFDELEKEIKNIRNERGMDNEQQAISKGEQENERISSEQSGTTTDEDRTRDIVSTKQSEPVYTDSKDNGLGAGKPERVEQKQSAVTVQKFKQWSKEEIARANQVNLYDVARSFGYELKDEGKAYRCAKSGGLYIYKDSNRYYNFNDQDKGSAIDFVVKETGKDFREAVAYLLNENEYELVTYTPKRSEESKEEKDLIIPEKNKDFKKLYWYMLGERKIDKDVLNHFVKEKSVYQDNKGNVVFLGFDEKNKARYCSKRGTSLDKPFKGDMTGSDKSYPFVLKGKSDTVEVVEAPIDVMSKASIKKLQGQDWKENTIISLGCTNDGALEYFLKNNPHITKIIVGLDNDFNAKNKDGIYTNWGQQSAQKLVDKYSSSYEVTNEVPILNDWNDDLREYQRGSTPSELENIKINILCQEFSAIAVDEVQLGEQMEL